MSILNSCARCGAKLRPHQAEGLCTRCLLESGLDAPLDQRDVRFAGSSPTGGAASESAGSSVSQEAIRSFGDYELLEEIARGGMGVVYRARQSSLGRIVALKMMLSGPRSSPELVKRFRAEASASASLQHPNIVAIHEVGVHQDQQYFAMDFVEGQSLAKMLATGPLPGKRAAGYLKTIAEAIHYAHERGLLHRDLKPSNVLIDGADQPRVTDFGLARRLESNSELTLSGQVLGSPNYMPPEQAGAKRGQLSRRSDVYALGAMLYHLLTGRPPFIGETIADTLRQVIDSEPVSPRLLNPSVPRDLETLCLKCLEKAPGKRYQTAQELAEELNRFLNGEPICARPLSGIERAWRWCGRNPRTAILSVSVIVLLSTVAIGSTLAAIRIRRAERVATEQLFGSYIAQARAMRHNGREGERFDSLQLVAKAAAIRSSLELRSEAIACLAVTDVRFRDPQTSADPENEAWDPKLEKRAFSEGDGRIRVHRIADNSEIGLLPSLGTGVGWLGPMSPGGAYLAVNYFDGRNGIWDIQRQQLIITNLAGGMTADFGADGQSVAVSCQDGQLWRFGLDPVRALSTLAINRKYQFLCLCPRGDRFAGCEVSKGEVEVRDLRDGSLLQNLTHSVNVRCLAWSSDAADIATGHENGRICIWNTSTGEKKNEFKAHQDTVISVGFSHSGRLLGSSSWDGDFRLWDIPADRLLLTTFGNSFQVSFSEDDSRIGYIQRGLVTGSLEVTRSSVFRRLNSKPSKTRGSSFSIDISADSRLVAVGFAGGVKIWVDQQTDEPFLLPAGSCYSVIFAPDATNLITCGESGLAFWPIARKAGATINELRIGPRIAIQDGVQFNYAALSVDARWVAAANPGDRAVSVYEVQNPTNGFELVSQPRAQFPALSPDGQWVAVGNFKSSGVKVWNLKTRALVRELATPSSAWVTFSPDNLYLATGGSTVDLWETGSWKHKYAIQKDRAQPPTPLTFSPDGQMLAIEMEPGIVRLVTPETGQVLANLEAPGADYASFLRFSPDSSQLFALEWDQQIQVWDLQRARAELRKLNLDWNAPSFPAEAVSGSASVKPLRIVLEDGSQ